jgi:aspartyl-tRNA(Asn)/glutamyl-tRNA(Gln) amidotransferase subunit B
VSPEPVIGLEVHVRLRTRTKIFCGCRNAYGGAPNTRTCPVCLGLPGTLPVLNAEAVDLALRLGTALRCRVAPRSAFARKSYFYPDLPRNYQITQHAEPLCTGGALAVGPPDDRRGIPLRRLHLEEDAGKSLAGAAGTRVDLNRAGAPLVELVTEPALASADDAYLFLRELRRLVRALDVSDGDMARGSLRCDANVSLRPRPGAPPGARVELKNLNSVRGVRRALAYEIARQGDRLARGEPVRPETRGWNAARRRSVFQRSKEAAADYRYFPEPDLPPLVIDAAAVETVRASLPELPADRQMRFVSDLGVPPELAATLVETPALAAYFEETAAVLDDPRAAAAWTAGEVLRVCGETGVAPDRFRVPPAGTADLLRRVASGELSRSAAKTVFDRMAREGVTAAEVLEREDLSRIGTRGELAPVVASVVANHPGQVALYRAGSDGVVNWFVGQVLSATGGRADPRLVAELLREALASADDS